MSNTAEILKTILAIIFLLLAALKIFGLNPMKKMFNEFKLNQLAMILIGMIEILCVVSLFIPNLAFFACIGFAYITTSAILRQIKAHHSVIKLMPAVVLLVLSLITAAVVFTPS